jgi:hypothetical protein
MDRRGVVATASKGWFEIMGRQNLDFLTEGESIHDAFCRARSESGDGDRATSKRDIIAMSSLRPVAYPRKKERLRSGSWREPY